MCSFNLAPTGAGDGSFKELAAIPNGLLESGLTHKRRVMRVQRQLKNEQRASNVDSFALHN
jgi:hypothetical protein